jgi:PQQ-like domain
MRSRAFAALGLSVVSVFSLPGCGGGSKFPAAAMTAPAIMTHPESKTVLVGETTTFSATATGTAPLSYQWQKNSIAISGANASSYTTPPAISTDNGSQFRVVVSNSLGSATSNPATLTVSTSVAPMTPPAIMADPESKTVLVGETATFSATATGTAPLSYQWQKNSVAISGANASSHTTPPAISTDNGSQFRVVVSNSAGSATSDQATLTVTSTPPPNVLDVVTYHNDIARTGQNLKETILTTENVNSSTFGKLRSLSVDGKVDAQPLYLSNLANIAGGTHNVLYVVTEHGSVYAFDPDSGAQLWKISTLGSGESTSDTRRCEQINPEIGITATPVIDRQAGTHGVIYVVAMSRSGSTYFQRLHALDITTGAEMFGGPKLIEASFPGTGDNSSNGRVVFDPAQYKERAALLLLNGVVYTTWASHCDIRPYTGWIMGYDQTTLVQATVLNVVPNGSEGAIWMADTGPAADSGGNIYLLDANGDFGTTLDAGGFPRNGNYGNAFLKISTSGGLSVADYFEMHNQRQENDSDVDLGSGGALVLPDLTDGSGNVRHLAVGAGKDGHMYVVNRDAMGKFNPSSNNIYQDLTGVLGGVFSMPAYFSGTLYYGAVGDAIKAFKITNAQFGSGPAFQTSNTFRYPGTTPSISANGTSNAIVWAVENNSTAVLHAYDANNLHELYNSDQASGSRDQFGAGNKFITPMIVNGKVYVGTTNSVGVFGLLP